MKQIDGIPIGLLDARYQGLDATLTSIAALGTAADRMLYTTGIDTWAETIITAFGRSLIDDADAAAGRTTLGLVAGGAGDIWVEKAGDTMTGQLFIDGSADVIQQRVQAHSTQTANLVTYEKSDGTVLSGVDSQGRLFSYGAGGIATNAFYSGAGNATLTGVYNLGTGINSLDNLTTGTGNIGYGYSSLTNCTEGNYNFGIGGGSLEKVTTSSNNLGIGLFTLSKLTINSNGNNCALGNYALLTTTGGLNVGIGGNAARLSNATGVTAIGYQAGYNSTGNYGIFLGFCAGFRQTTNAGMFIVDNAARASAAEEQTNAILYGVMAALPANQTLRINAETSIYGNLFMPTNYTALFRDTAIGIYSQADTFLDMFADGGIRIGDSSAGAPTNYSNFSSAGRLSFFGTAGVELPYLLQTDSTTQAIVNVANAQLVTFDTDVYHSGITRTSSSRFTIPTAGTYRILISAIADTTVANKEIEMWFAVDGSYIAGSNTIVRMPSTNTETTIAVEWVQTFTANQYFEIFMWGDSTGVQLLATAAGSTPTRPACPSIIMSCNMISKN